MTEALRAWSRQLTDAMEAGEPIEPALRGLQRAYQEHVARDGFAKTCWSIDDILSRRPAWTEAEAGDWLRRHAGLIQDAMVEAGWEAIDALLDDDQPSGA